MEQPGIEPTEDKIPEEKKTKKSGFWVRWGRRGKKPNNAAPLLGGGGSGGGAATSAESLAARAAGGLKSPGMLGGAGRSIGAGAESAAARAAAAAVKPQVLFGAGAGRSAGLLSTLKAFLSSPLGILAAVVGIVAMAGAAAMYYSAHSSSVSQYASHFDAASIASDNAGRERGASGSLPIAGISEDGAYQPAEAGAMPEGEETIGEPLGANSSADGGSSEGNSDPAKTAPGKLGSSMSNEFAQNFGKAGGLGSASPSAFTMATPGGSDSSAQSLPNNAVGSRPGGNAASFGKLAGMKLDRGGGGGGGRGARAGGGGTKKAWQQMGKVKTALEGAAAAGGEEGVAQAAATWDGGSGGGGAGAAGGSDGGSSSGASVPAGADAPSAGDMSAGGGGPADPALVGESLTEDMENPMLPIATELVTAVGIASGLIVGLFFAVMAFKADPEPISKIILLIAAIAATIAAIYFIVQIGILAAKFFNLGQTAEGITAVVSIPVLLVGVVGAWLGKPWMAGLGAVGALVTAFAGPLIASAFGG